MLIRVSLFGVLAAWFTFSANAQVSVGATAGANLTFLRWNSRPNNTDLGFEPALGYRFAATADWRLGSRISLRGEAGYQVWRVSTTTTAEDPGGSQMEIVGRYYQAHHSWAGSLLAGIAPFRQNRLYFLAGTSVATITALWASVSENLRFDPNAPERTAIDLTGYNRFQVFADLGAGIRFPVGNKGAFLTEMRYQLSLTKLSVLPGVTSGISPLLLNLGYLFQL